MLQYRFVDLLPKGQQILIKRLEADGVRLPVEWEARLSILVEHQWQAISYDVSGQDLDETVLEMEKYVESNSNSFLDTLFKEIQPIFLINFI